MALALVNVSIWGPQIPFDIAEGDFDQNQRQIVDAAIERFNWHGAGRFEFVPHRGERDFVVFRRAQSSCSSYVGRRPRGQTIHCNLSPGSGFGTPSMLHEILHAVGFVHEHQRIDRDQFVNVTAEAMSGAGAINYGISHGSSAPGLEGLGSVDPIGRYDYRSLMHYREIPGTISPKTPDGNQMGTSADFSPGDLAGLFFLAGFRDGIRHARASGSKVTEPELYEHIGRLHMELARLTRRVADVESPEA